MSEATDIRTRTPPDGIAPLNGVIKSVTIEQLIQAVPMWKRKHPTMFVEREPTGELYIDVTGDFVLPAVGEWVLVEMNGKWYACQPVKASESFQAFGEHVASVMLYTRRDWMRQPLAKISA